MRELDASGEPIAAPDDLRGLLLAATPQIGDGTFERTVVFMIEHGDEGSLGVILTRPLELPVAELLPRWADGVSTPPTLFSGGPVNGEAIIALGEIAEGIDSSELPDGLAPVDGFPAVATLDLNEDPALTLHAVTRTRLFLGYSGWTAGQLEAELQAGAWFVFEPSTADLFDPDPHGLRDRVFARQRTRHRIFENFPDDPSFN